ncbi:NAD-P-binding protein [Stereum hirsutum FP-91666 SS1]|uniref:NAD-P-binding protein n=1 Tax=Stereum hirsutum (strain FP-91666) TaxID=721885 RepID=UPI000444A2DA|nr:NAD-P-binding protein [Stereum hirsutum FP-91666 SS1]EIM86317.1 NAD-P-binding protein [Stereum hirsutum FP-91666 SS1]
MGKFWDFVVMMANESFPPKPTWTTEDVPDLTGKVIIVTGGNSGLGLELTKVLVSRNATVYIACRSKERAVIALEEIKADTNGREAKFLHLDLADLDSVRTGAEEFLRNETRLDILYNSAGVMIPPMEQLSAQGYDLQMGTNVLGHFYLTKLLLPTLLATATLEPGSYNKPRIVTVSSGAHHLHDIDYATLKDGPERRRLGTQALYAQSKYASVVFARELARRYGDQGLVSIAMNPGNLKTNLQKEVAGWQRVIVDWMLHSVLPNGILTHLYAGTAEEAADYNGKYLIPWARLGKARTDTQDPKRGEELWAWLEEQVNNR